MANRNGTYVSFHTAGGADDLTSDIAYYREIQSWHKDGGKKFQSLTSHDAFNAERSPANNGLVQASVRDRLDQSRNVILIISEATKSDTNWVPYELEYAIAERRLPIIAAYVGQQTVLEPNRLRYLWPEALTKGIRGGGAKVIHVPFHRETINDAMTQFHPGNTPFGPLAFYSEGAHKFFGIMPIRRAA